VAVIHCVPTTSLVPQYIPKPWCYLPSLNRLLAVSVTGVCSHDLTDDADFREMSK